MSKTDGLNRRSFLRNAGMTALAGAAVATGAPLVGKAAAGAAPHAPNAPVNGKYDFDTVYNRFGTDSTKFDQQIRIYGKDAIQVGMGIADIDFRAAPSITEALQERLKHENWGYLDMVKANGELYSAVTAWNKKRYGIDIDPALLGTSTGVHPAIIATLQAFSPPGSKVLLQTPTYNGFYSDLTYTRTKPEDVPLKNVDGKFSMDFEEFEKRITNDTNSFILCNPQNPTGNCWSAEDLTRIGEICLRRRVLVLADEIHCDWVTKGNKYTPFASLPNKAIVNNSVTFKAASKSFGLAAHKVAWFYSTNPEIMAKVRPYLRADLNTLGMVANQAAVTKGEDWLNQAVEYVDGTHDFVVKFVAANLPQIKVVKPQGTYLCWLDCTAVANKINTKQLAAEFNRTKPAGTPDLTPEQMLERYFIKNAKVSLNQGASYGTGGANHMRMNIGTSRKLVELALTNLANAMKTTGTSMA